MRELLRLLPYLKRYKTKLIAGFIFVTISNICSTYVPRIVGNSIDLIKSGGFSANDIFQPILILLLLTAGSGLFMFLTRRTIIVSSRLIEYDLRNDFLLALERQDLSFYNTNPTGTLMAHATNDMNAAREFLGPAVMYAANSITVFAFAFYFMVSLNVNITLLALLPLPIIAVTVYIIGKKVHIAFKDVQAQFSLLTAQAQETFSGIHVVKAYLRETYESSLFNGLSRDYLKKNLKLARLQSVIMPVLMVLVGLSQIIVLGYGGLQVIDGRATLGDLTQYFIYLNMLIWPVAAIGWITNIIQRAAASTGRIGKILDMQPAIFDSENTLHSIKNIEGDIEFKDVSLSYNGNSRKELSNISVKIPCGTSLGIVGGVGTGKSSFVNLLPRLYESSSGQILIDDYEIEKIPLNILRKSIGIVPQDTFLFSMSIEENIRFGKPDATLDEIKEAARIARLEEEINSFPEGYSTILGERGITLSGGQKQRLAIARAVLKKPSILILDDALSAVDTQTEEKILTNLHKFMENRTSIIISHRISTVKDCVNIIALENGKIVESGTHEQLLKNTGKYYDMYALQRLEQEIAGM